jgi:predicted CoA-binding protein
VDPKEIARSARVVAVVGASPEPGRPSNEIMQYLLDKGVEVIPIRPGCDSILGQACVESLADVGRRVDIVDVFRRSEAAAEVTREAVALGARAVWLQEGVRSEEAAAIAREAGIAFVQDVCLKRVLKDLAREDRLSRDREERPTQGSDPGER